MTARLTPRVPELKKKIRPRTRRSVPMILIFNKGDDLPDKLFSFNETVLRLFLYKHCLHGKFSLFLTSIRI